MSSTLEPITRVEQFLSDIIDQGGGGGGSGGGGNVLVVNVTATKTSDGTTATFDKTFAELKTAYESNAVMLCNVTTVDNINSVSGNSIAFLTYRPAMQFPLPAPEMFSFDISFLNIGGVSRGYVVSGAINAEGTSAAIQMVGLTTSN